MFPCLPLSHNVYPNVAPPHLSILILFAKALFCLYCQLSLSLLAFFVFIFPWPSSLRRSSIFYFWHSCLSHCLAFRLSSVPFCLSVILSYSVFLAFLSVSFRHFFLCHPLIFRPSSISFCLSVLFSVILWCSAFLAFISVSFCHFFLCHPLVFRLSSISFVSFCHFFLCRILVFHPSGVPLFVETGNAFSGKCVELLSLLTHSHFFSPVNCGLPFSLLII